MHVKVGGDNCPRNVLLFLHIVVYWPCMVSDYSEVYSRYFWSCSQNSSGFSVAEEIVEGGQSSCSTEVYVQGSSTLLVLAYGCHGECC